MNRRNFLKLITSAVAAETLDIDRLLWIPGQKTIFIPSVRRLTTGEIVALELERLQHKMKDLFERDSYFYVQIEKHSGELVSARPMRVPLVIKPGHND